MREAVAMVVKAKKRRSAGEKLSSSHGGCSGSVPRVGGSRARSPISNASAKPLSAEKWG